MLLGLICAAIAIWWTLKSLGITSRAQIAKVGRSAGGVGALGVAALLALRGRMDVAALVAAGGGWLLGWNALPPPFGGRIPARASSRVRSRMIELVLEGAGETLSGRVLSGPLSGRALDDLSGADLLRLHHECLSADPEGARLLEAYLDRRLPRWREDADARAHEGRRSEPQLGAMSKQEAYQVLGLEPGASDAAVRDAHRALIGKLHPDRGGSTYLASRVNQAKDVLLDRHR